MDADRARGLVASSGARTGSRLPIAMAGPARASVMTPRQAELVERHRTLLRDHRLVPGQLHGPVLHVDSARDLSHPTSVKIHSVIEEVWGPVVRVRTLEEALVFLSGGVELDAMAERLFGQRIPLPLSMVILPMFDYVYDQVVSLAAQLGFLPEWNEYGTRTGLALFPLVRAALPHVPIMGLSVENDYRVKEMIDGWRGVTFLNAREVDDPRAILARMETLARANQEAGEGSGDARGMIRDMQGCYSGSFGRMHDDLILRTDRDVTGTVRQYTYVDFFTVPLARYRNSDRARLQALITQASWETQAGKPFVIVVAGQRNVGKSTMIESVVAGLPPEIAGSTRFYQSPNIDRAALQKSGVHVIELDAANPQEALAQLAKLGVKEGNGFAGMFLYPKPFNDRQLERYRADGGMPTSIRFDTQEGHRGTYYFPAPK